MFQPGDPVAVKIVVIANQWGTQFDREEWYTGKLVRPQTREDVVKQLTKYTQNPCGEIALGPLGEYWYVVSDEGGHQRIASASNLMPLAEYQLLQATKGLS